MSTQSLGEAAAADWRQWLASAKVTKDPVGDFIGDARRDPRMADAAITSRAALSRFLMSRGACAECLDAVPEIWARFHGWRRFLLWRRTQRSAYAEHRREILERRKLEPAPKRGAAP